MFLSGGIDSSTVCALLTKEGIKLKTFTIGFYEKDYNEAEHAKKIANYLGTKHIKLYCTLNEAFEIIPKLSSFTMNPLGIHQPFPPILFQNLPGLRLRFLSLQIDEMSSFVAIRDTS